jgi:hypothetical protein
MPFVGGARIGTFRPAPVAPKLTHSSVSKIALHWSPGQGMRPPPGGPPPRMWGLYLTGSVHKGHHLHVDGVKLNKANKTVTIQVDARGQGAPGKTSVTEEKFVGGGFPLKAERWTVIVKDGGKVVAKKSMMLGGPPAP